jgi:hypothetical protein
MSPPNGILVAFHFFPARTNRSAEDLPHHGQGSDRKGRTSKQQDDDEDVPDRPPGIEPWKIHGVKAVIEPAIPT